LVEIIHNSFFKTSTAFGYKYQKYFISSHLTWKELELSILLIALVVTGISFVFYIQNNIQIFSSYMLLLVHGRQVFVNGSIQTIKQQNIGVYHDKPATTSHVSNISIPCSKLGIDLL